LILLQIAGPREIKPKVSGLGIWLLLTGPAILIAELIFVTSVIDSSGGVNYYMLGYIMLFSFILSICIFIGMNFIDASTKNGSIFEQSNPHWRRNHKNII
jgi:hypothetical protein